MHLGNTNKNNDERNNFRSILKTWILFNLDCEHKDE
jgi:hypothetical protein